MTIILTHCTKDEIIFISDSKRTIIHEDEIKIDTKPFIKTKIIPDKNWGISVWGTFKERTNKQLWKWINEQYSKDKSIEIDEFAKILENGLNSENFPEREKYRFGIHLAGFRKANPNITVFYHITNTKEDNLTPKPNFTAQLDWEYSSENKIKTTTNGFFEPVRFVFKDISVKFEEQVQVIDYFVARKHDPQILKKKDCSENIIEKFAEYYCSIIKIFQSILDRANMISIIGDPIYAVIINKEGIKMSLKLATEKYTQLPSDLIL